MFRTSYKGARMYTVWYTLRERKRRNVKDKEQNKDKIN